MPCSVFPNIIDLSGTSLANWVALPILFDRGEQKNTVPKSGERWHLDGMGEMSASDTATDASVSWCVRNEMFYTFR